MKRLTFKRRGFSLLEVMLGLAIAIFVVSALFFMLPKVQSSQRADRESRNIGAIKAGVKTLYGGVSNYVGLSNTVAINARIIPENMLVSGSTTRIVNAYGGDVTVYASDYGISKTTGSSFTLIYTKVPTEDCIKMVPPVAGDLSAAQINGTRVKEIGGVLDLDALVTACKAGGNVNQINLSTL